MTPGDQISPDQDVVGQVVAAVSNTLVRRGYFTTEWWTTIIAGALSTVLALVHVSSSNATHVAAVLAPTVLAALYGVARNMHKSALASVLGDLLPQAAGTQAPPAGGPAPGAPAPGAPAAPGPGAPTVPSAPAAPGAPTGAGTQTDPDFTFEGIPPIQDDPEEP